MIYINISCVSTLIARRSRWAGFLREYVNHSCALHHGLIYTSVGHFLECIPWMFIRSVLRGIVKVKTVADYVMFSIIFEKQLVSIVLSIIYFTVLRWATIEQLNEPSLVRTSPFWQNRQHSRNAAIFTEQMLNLQRIRILTIHYERKCYNFQRREIPTTWTSN